MPRHSRTSRPLAFGFVEFADRADAWTAIQAADGRSMDADGPCMNVSWSNTSKPPGTGLSNYDKASSIIGLGHFKRHFCAAHDFRHDQPRGREILLNSRTIQKEQGRRFKCDYVFFRKDLCLRRLPGNTSSITVRDMCAPFARPT